ncbi:hypothetical protein H5P28_11750 [Ruficoccus amylovorans]|uniref:Uncharacterized protein n=1 Tax=Ruficoccus amylovorans TaxID=1804625 RepID=A0A842HI81_9BACT|nr:hypothetical protein [Ruficoccus amylovorans]MBC2594931.1 hypothetical protein [Ruficoccus amylovorans]
MSTVYWLMLIALLVKVAFASVALRRGLRQIADLNRREARTQEQIENIHDMILRLNGDIQRITCAELPALSLEEAEQCMHAFEPVIGWYSDNPCQRFVGIIAGIDHDPVPTRGLRLHYRMAKGGWFDRVARIPSLDANRATEAGR